MNAQIAKEIDAGMKNIEEKAEAAFKLGHGSFGNGITVWNSAKEVSGDYEKVAHINTFREITYYIENLPAKIIAHIENIANNSNPSASTSQPECKVFRTIAKAGHTQGPWEYRKSPHAAYPIFLINSSYGALGEIRGEEADAKLIAASPTLLDACEAALAVFKSRFPVEHGTEEIGMAWFKLETAIKRAEGNA